MQKSKKLTGKRSERRTIRNIAHKLLKLYCIGYNLSKFKLYWFTSIIKSKYRMVVIPNQTGKNINTILLIDESKKNSDNKITIVAFYFFFMEHPNALVDDIYMTQQILQTLQEYRIDGVNVVEWIVDSIKGQKFKIELSTVSPVHKKIASILEACEFVRDDFYYLRTKLRNYKVTKYRFIKVL